MIFVFPGHIDQIVDGTKTQTRRNSSKYKVGQTYAIQPGRCKPGDPRGRILITRKWRETPINPITEHDAQAEGGYNSIQYECLYSELAEGWRERWCYEFEFWETESIESLENALKDAQKHPSTKFFAESQQVRTDEQ